MCVSSSSALALSTHVDTFPCCGVIWGSSFLGGACQWGRFGRLSESKSISILLSVEQFLWAQGALLAAFWASAAVRQVVRLGLPLCPSHSGASG